MYVWVAMVFLKFIHDPLIAGRLVSVMTGFLTMLGIFFLTLELFKNKATAFLAAVLICFLPVRASFGPHGALRQHGGDFLCLGIVFFGAFGQKNQIGHCLYLGIYHWWWSINQKLKLFQYLLIAVSLNPF